MPNVIVPVLVSRLTPVPPEPDEVVSPKLSAALEVLTLIPIPVGLLMAVAAVARLPATLVRLMPVVLLLVDTMKPNVAASVPFVRLRA